MNLLLSKCFFWYQLTRVVPEKGHKTVVVVTYYWWYWCCQEIQSSYSASARRCCGRWTCGDDGNDVVNRCRARPGCCWDVSQGADGDVHWYVAALYVLQQLKSS